MNIKLSEKADERLRNLLSAYIQALQITVDTLGLDGEWTYDATTGSLLLVQAKPEVAVENVPGQPTQSERNGNGEH